MRKFIVIFFLLLCCALQAADNLSVCEKQLRDAAALYGRRSMEYALAMSRIGAYYADTLNADYNRKKAWSYLEPAAVLAVSLDNGSEQCAQVLLPYMDLLMHSSYSARALSYAASLYMMFDNASKRFYDMTRDEVIVWFEHNKPYSDMLFAVLDQNDLSKAEEDMLYNMCLIEKSYFASSRYDKHTAPVRFSDIANVLESNDVAIEFASYTYGGETYYTSSRLKKGWKHPKKQSICRQDSLMQMAVLNKPLLNRYEEFYAKIWGNLAPGFHKDDRIWFAPAGDLHLLSIEYCKIPKTKTTCLADIFRMHRTFSTARLLSRKQRSNMRMPVKRAMLYGNVDYGKGLWRELPQTSNEVNMIEQTLKTAGYSTEKLMQKQASMGNFLAMSGKKYGMIHIATHGFYNANESNPMYACGLIMANGNCAFRADSIYLDACDGVITAAEIDTMHLPDTRLVVLSACRSGLGRVVADNVIGMQSAFRYAGAEAMMTSLWNVNDEATSILMKTFYREYLHSQGSLQEALRDAQKAVRKQHYVIGNISYDGYAPKFWAAFIIYE